MSHIALSGWLEITFEKFTPSVTIDAFSPKNNLLDFGIEVRPKLA
jgi:hypothetical protein